MRMKSLVERDKTLAVEIPWRYNRHTWAHDGFPVVLSYICHCLCHRDGSIHAENAARFARSRKVSHSLIVNRVFPHHFSALLSFPS
jgi:hypothetical protein